MGGQRHNEGTDAVFNQVQNGGSDGQARRVVVGYGHRYLYRRRIAVAAAGSGVPQRGRVVGGIAVGGCAYGYPLRCRPVGRGEGQRLRRCGYIGVVTGNSNADIVVGPRGQGYGVAAAAAFGQAQCCCRHRQGRIRRRRRGGGVVHLYAYRGDDVVVVGAVGRVGQGGGFVVTVGVGRGGYRNRPRRHVQRPEGHFRRRHRNIGVIAGDGDGDGAGEDARVQLHRVGCRTAFLYSKAAGDEGQARGHGAVHGYRVGARLHAVVLHRAGRLRRRFIGSIAIRSVAAVHRLGRFRLRRGYYDGDFVAAVFQRDFHCGAADCGLAVEGHCGAGQDAGRYRDAGDLVGYAGAVIVAEADERRRQPYRIAFGIGQRQGQQLVGAHGDYADGDLIVHRPAAGGQREPEGHRGVAGQAGRGQESGRWRSGAVDGHHGLGPVGHSLPQIGGAAGRPAAAAVQRHRLPGVSLHSGAGLGQQGTLRGHIGGAAVLQYRVMPPPEIPRIIPALVVAGGGVAVHIHIPVSVNAGRRSRGRAVAGGGPHGVGALAGPAAAACTDLVIPVAVGDGAAYRSEAGTGVDRQAAKLGVSAATLHRAGGVAGHNRAAHIAAHQPAGVSGLAVAVGNAGSGVTGAHRAALRRAHPVLAHQPAGN